MNRLLRTIAATTTLLKGRLEAERGATAVEYAVMAAAIIGVVAVSAFALGVETHQLFQTANDAVGLGN